MLTRSYRAANISSIYVLWKILGWMHPKFRGNEPLQDFSIGNPCTCLSRQPSLDNLEYYPNSNSSPKPFGKGVRELHLKTSYPGLQSEYIKEDGFDEDSSAANSELFHGFLTIGTFGLDPITADPTSTPTFSISIENIAEREEDITEDYLKMINNELEKVLGYEEDESFGKKSHVSAGRDSHDNAITLSGKIFEGDDTVKGTLVCPLQNYLFGSTIDMTETTVAKNEQRTTLGELFKMENMKEETCDDKVEKSEKRKDKGNNKSAIRMMKSILRKTMVCETSKPEKKEKSSSKNKILRIFHRKIYPEGSVAPRESDKPSKNEKKSNIKPEKRYKNGDQFPPEENAMIFLNTSLSKEGIGCFKNHENLFEANGRDFEGNKEFWIKTDSDYLVLEL